MKSPAKQVQPRLSRGSDNTRFPKEGCISDEMGTTPRERSDRIMGGVALLGFRCCLFAGREGPTNLNPMVCVQDGHESSARWVMHGGGRRLHDWREVVFPPVDNSSEGLGGRWFQVSREKKSKKGSGGWSSVRRVRWSGRWRLAAAMASEEDRRHQNLELPADRLEGTNTLGYVDFFDCPR
ncbi:hypothetical protein L2E82_22523 [Cichorium intybus]|uniref:Uncharacterized protein n=1 Tax=Cichorium intybus TaxID=13427 RepID=A0ACB9DYZ1_CICIN|nr:hypothetical protein L2E82_22523 [Cichorium intybus]